MTTRTPRAFHSASLAIGFGKISDIDSGWTMSSPQQ
jgi:hypothetical protein